LLTSCKEVGKMGKIGKSAKLILELVVDIEQENW